MGPTHGAGFHRRLLSPKRPYHAKGTVQAYQALHGYARQQSRLFSDLLSIARAFRWENRRYEKGFTHQFSLATS